MRADIQYDAIVEHIYGAIGRPEVWNDVLGVVTRPMNGQRALLWIMDTAANRLLFSAAHNVPAEIVELFERKHLTNPTSIAVLQLAVGQPNLSSQPLVDPAEVVKLPIYRDIMAPLNFYYGSGGLMLREGNVAGMLMVVRAREPGPFSPEEDDALIRLLPHLCRAAQLQYRLLATELERAAAASVLDKLSHAVVICDGEARVLLANTVAKTMLAQKRGLRTIADRLAGSTAAQSNALVDAIRAVGDGGRNTASVTIETADETVRVLISRVSAELRLGLPLQADLVLVSFSDPAVDLAASAEVLKEMLKLTDAEARAALGLAHGKTMQDIADSLGVSLNTIRTHVASAFAKTQTSRQADLVRLVLRTVGPFGFG